MRESPHFIPISDEIRDKSLRLTRDWARIDCLKRSNQVSNKCIIDMRLLRKVSIGKDVKDLQQKLIALGYALTADGIFGLKTEAVVKVFQQENSLTVDGIVGANTLKQINDRMNSLAETEDEFKLGGKKLTEQDIEDTAQELSLEVAVIKSVCEVESRGSGFLSNRKPRILFEGHIFWKELKKLGISPEDYEAGNEDILYPKWTREYYLGGAKEYNRLDRAKKISEKAALASASWGMFQIMGFNYALCGFTDVNSYVKEQYLSEGNHLKAFGSFIQSTRLLRHLKAKNWAAFAKGYNGPSYKVNKYDEKLKKAYEKYAS